MIGVSRGTLWAAARDEGYIVIGEEIVRPIRVGTRISWPLAPIKRGLGLDESDPGAADPSAAGAARDDTSHAGSAAGS